MKFCSNCAAPVVKRVPPGDNLPRWVCDACGEIHYQNPQAGGRHDPRVARAGCCCAAARSSRATATGRCPPASWRTTRPPGQAALRETLEEAGARIELGAPFTMISVPYVNQVHLFYRARLLDLEFKPGEETPGGRALVEEAQVPWKDIAFRTVGLTLKHWFADRKAGTFGFHAEDILPR